MTALPQENQGYQGYFLSRQNNEINQNSEHMLKSKYNTTSKNPFMTNLSPILDEFPGLEADSPVSDYSDYENELTVVDRLAAIIKPPPIYMQSSTSAATTMAPPTNPVDDWLAEMGRRKLPTIPNDDQSMANQQDSAMPPETNHSVCGPSNCLPLNSSKRAAFLSCSDSELRLCGARNSDLWDRDEGSHYYDDVVVQEPQKVVTKEPVARKTQKIPITLARILLKQELKQAMVSRRRHLEACEIEANQREYSINRMLANGSFKKDLVPKVVKSSLPRDLVAGANIYREANFLPVSHSTGVQTASGTSRNPSRKALPVSPTNPFYSSNKPWKDQEQMVQKDAKTQTQTNTSSQASGNLSPSKYELAPRLTDPQLWRTFNNASDGGPTRSDKGVSELLDGETQNSPTVWLYTDTGNMLHKGKRAAYKIQKSALKNSDWDGTAYFSDEDDPVAMRQRISELREEIAKRQKKLRSASMPYRSRNRTESRSKSGAAPPSDYSSHVPHYGSLPRLDGPHPRETFRVENRQLENSSRELGTLAKSDVACDRQFRSMLENGAQDDVCEGGLLEDSDQYGKAFLAKQSRKRLPASLAEASASLNSECLSDLMDRYYNYGEHSNSANRWDAGGRTRPIPDPLSYSLPAVNNLDRYYNAFYGANAPDAAYATQRRPYSLSTSNSLENLRNWQDAATFNPYTQQLATPADRYADRRRNQDLYSDNLSTASAPAFPAHGSMLSHYASYLNDDFRRRPNALDEYSGPYGNRIDYPAARRSWIDEGPSSSKAHNMSLSSRPWAPEPVRSGANAWSQNVSRQYHQVHPSYSTSQGQASHSMYPTGVQPNNTAATDLSFYRNQNDLARLSLERDYPSQTRTRGVYPYGSSRLTTHPSFPVQPAAPYGGRSYSDNRYAMSNGEAMSDSAFAGAYQYSDNDRALYDPYWRQQMNSTQRSYRPGYQASYYDRQTDL